MSPALKSRARWARTLRRLRYALHALGPLAFPICHPRLWLFCRWLSLIYWLHYSLGRPDLSMRLVAWRPADFDLVSQIVRERGYPFPGVLL